MKLILIWTMRKREPRRRSNANRSRATRKRVKTSSLAGDRLRFCHRDMLRESDRYSKRSVGLEMVQLEEWKYIWSSCLLVSLVSPSPDLT
jgi:hypothetical protein